MKIVQKEGAAYHVLHAWTMPRACGPHTPAAPHACVHYVSMHLSVHARLDTCGHLGMHGPNRGAPNTFFLMLVVGSVHLEACRTTNGQFAVACYGLDFLAQIYLYLSLKLGTIRQIPPCPMCTHIHNSCHLSSPLNSAYLFSTFLVYLDHFCNTSYYFCIFNCPFF